MTERRRKIKDWKPWWKGGGVDRCMGRRPPKIDAAV